MAPKLLIRPEPLEGESFYSWLSRAAAANASRSKRRIMELADLFGSNKRIKPYPIFSQMSIERLSELTGVECSKILTTLWSESIFEDVKSKFSRQFVFCDRAKICPLCVEENKCWLKAWQLLSVTSCVNHSIRLTTTCKCGKPIELFSVSVTHCECGRHYSKQKLIKATASELELSNYALIGFEGKADTALQDKLSEIQFCLWYWYQSVRGHDDQLIRSWGNRRIVSGCKYVGSLIERGRLDIKPLLSRFVDSVGNSQSGFRSVMGNCHDYMGRLVDIGYTGDLVNQLTDFEEHGWHGADFLRRVRFGASSKLITTAELASVHQCKKVKVERLIEYGDIGLVAKEGRVKLVDSSNPALISNKVAAWLSLDDAAELLNISKDWVVQLVESKLIDGRKNSHQRDWLIARRSCDSLVDQLKLRSVAEEDYLVTLKSLQLLPRQNFSKIIKACLGRKVSYQISDYNAPLAGLRVDCRYIQRLLLREKGALLSAMDLTEYLSVNLNAIYYLISKQYINVRSRYCRNRKVYGFYLEDIDEFERNCCFHYEAKSFLLLSGRRDLLPAIKPSNKRCSHRSKVRIYKWQYITGLLNKPSTDSKLTRLFRLEAAAKFVGKSSAQIHSFLEREWIVPYKAPSHHLTGHHFIEFCITDLKRLKVLLDDHPNLMPIRAASKYLGYDRSHIRKQFICSGYLSTKVVPEYPKELFCFKREVFSLKRLLSRTVTGPELSKIMGVTRNTIYKWMKSGKLRPALTPNNAGFGCYRYKIPKNIIGHKSGNSSMQK